jgi:hypothetical protein
MSTIEISRRALLRAGAAIGTASAAALAFP